MDQRRPKRRPTLRAQPDPRRVRMYGEPGFAQALREIARLVCDPGEPQGDGLVQPARGHGTELLMGGARVDRLHQGVKVALLELDERAALPPHVLYQAADALPLCADPLS